MLQIELYNVDTIITVRDYLITTHMPIIASIANKYNVTVCSSDLSSIARGASLSFGSHDTRFGDCGAELAFNIIEHNMHPSDIPIIHHKVENDFLINFHAAEKQGISNDKHNIERLENIYEEFSNKKKN